MSYAEQTEQAISDARTAVVNVIDEDLPEVRARDTATGAFELHDSVQDRLNLTLKKLDLASDMLAEFGYKYEDALDEISALKTDLENTIEDAEAINAQWFAGELLHELRGRRMTDSPEQVVWWLEHALTRIAYSEVNDSLLPEAVRA